MRGGHTLLRTKWACRPSVQLCSALNTSIGFTSHNSEWCRIAPGAVINVTLAICTRGESDAELCSKAEDVPSWEDGIKYDAPICFCSFAFHMSEIYVWSQRDMESLAYLRGGENDAPKPVIGEVYIYNTPGMSAARFQKYPSRMVVSPLDWL